MANQILRIDQIKYYFKIEVYRYAKMIIRISLEGVFTRRIMVLSTSKAKTRLNLLHQNKEDNFLSKTTIIETLVW